jgi:hypothetical protein
VWSAHRRRAPLHSSPYASMEHIRTLTIEGLRGFETAQSVDLAMPNGEVGSGLTVIVGTARPSPLPTSPWVLRLPGNRDAELVVEPVRRDTARLVNPLAQFVLCQFRERPVLVLKAGDELAPQLDYLTGDIERHVFEM